MLSVSLPLYVPPARLTRTRVLSSALCLGQLLTRLVLQFIFPETADIQALRQCLGYFLPVYCFSSPLNQRRMKDVFLSTLRLLISEGDEDGITPSQLTLLFLDWTDPQRAV